MHFGREVGDQAVCLAACNWRGLACEILFRHRKRRIGRGQAAEAEAQAQGARERKLT